MAKKGAEEVKSEVLQVVEEAGGDVGCENQLEIQAQAQQQHPYAFHVSGPRNVPTINWRDLINSTWYNRDSSSSLLDFWFDCSV